jgi:hypothetical protein
MSFGNSTSWRGYLSRGEFDFPINAATPRGARARHLNRSLRSLGALAHAPVPLGVLREGAGCLGLASAFILPGEHNYPPTTNCGSQRGLVTTVAAIEVRGGGSSFMGASRMNTRRRAIAALTCRCGDGNPMPPLCSELDLSVFRLSAPLRANAPRSAKSATESGQEVACYAEPPSLGVFGEVAHGVDDRPGHPQWVSERAFTEGWYSPDFPFACVRSHSRSSSRLADCRGADGVFSSPTLYRPTCRAGRRPRTRTFTMIPGSAL